MNLAKLPSDVTTNIMSYLCKTEALKFTLTSHEIREGTLANLIREHRGFYKGDGVDGCTRLMRAASERSFNWNKIRFIVNLLGKRAIVVQDEYGVTAIHRAVRAGNLEVIDLLCEIGGKDAVLLKDSMGNSALYEAVNTEDMDVVERLCKTGGRDLVMLKNNMGMTAIHNSVKLGNFEITYLLCTVDGGIDAASLRNNDGETALSIATDHFHTDIVVLLSSLQ